MVVVLLLSDPIRAAGNDVPFSPIHKPATWYTDRSLVDIEVVESTGSGDQARFIEPRQSLKLRLERAYVLDIGWHEKPDVSSVMLGFDAKTLLPSELFSAPVEQVERHGDDITRLLHDESVRRTRLVTLNGNSLSDNLRDNSRKLSLCRGEKLPSGLFAFKNEATSDCRLRSGLGLSNYVAEISAGLFAQVSCNNNDIGCSVSFPFLQFAPSLSFHRDHLDNLTGEIERASSFLDAKLYRRQP